MSAIHPSELAFITRHAPFDSMELAHVMWMLERMHLAYYAQGEVIAAPEQGEATRMWVIKQAWCWASRVWPRPRTALPGWS